MKDPFKPIVLTVSRPYNSKYSIRTITPASRTVPWAPTRTQKPLNAFLATKTANHVLVLIQTSALLANLLTSSMGGVVCLLALLALFKPLLNATRSALLLQSFLSIIQCLGVSLATLNAKPAPLNLFALFVKTTTSTIF